MIKPKILTYLTFPGRKRPCFRSFDTVADFCRFVADTRYNKKYIIEIVNGATLHIDNGVIVKTV